MKDVNDSLMGRTDVSVTKVWAPTLDEIQAKVHAEIEIPDTIVIQALTRDLGNMDTDAFLQKLEETVDMCISKSKNTMISHIVPRYDTNKTPGIDKKVAFVNAAIKVKYMNNPRITLCDHDNLDDPRYRKTDKLHLVEIGTSRYACNLKYGIADSLKITIKKKNRNEGRDFRDPREPRNSRDTRDTRDTHDSRNIRGPEYRGTAWERKNQRWKFEPDSRWRKSRWDDDLY